MFAVLSRLKSGVAALAGHVEDLAATVAEIRVELRRRVGLDAEPVGAESPPLPALENGARKRQRA